MPGKKLSNDSESYIQKAKKLLYEKHGENIELLDFAGSGIWRSVGTFYSRECGHTWTGILYRVVIQGFGCSICARRTSYDRKLIPESQILKMLEDKHCVFIKFVDKNVGKWANFEICYSCGHYGTTNYGNLYKHETGLCPDCSFESSRPKKRKQLSEIEYEINALGFKLLKIHDPEKGVFSLADYACMLGHITTRALSQVLYHPSCAECKRIKMAEIHKGKNSYRWKGGLTAIRGYLRKNIKEWKKDSAKNSDYKCIIENQEFDVIHHLYGFNLIVENAFEELSISIKENVGDYTESELETIKEKIVEIHNRLLGVCLTKRAHDFFHKLYGHGNNTPDQFEEFKQRISSGKIKLPE